MAIFEQHRIVGGIGADDEFWRGLEEGELRLPKCAGCDKWIWPAHYRCGECGAWELNWQALPARGRIFSWTRTWYPFERVKERSADVPYVTLLVEIDGADGVRVLGLLEGVETGLKIGADVAGKILPPSEKTKYYPSISWSLIPGEEASI